MTTTTDLATSLPDTLTHAELLAEFERCRADHDDRPRDVGLDLFQIGDEPTPYGQYLSAVRRMLSSFHSLVRAQWTAAERRGPYNRRSSDPKEEWQARAAELSMTQRKAEFCRLFAQAMILRRSLPDLDDPETRRRLEIELLVARCRLEIADDLLTEGRVRRSTLGFLRKLPREDRLHLMDIYTPRPDEVETIVDRDTGNIRHIISAAFMSRKQAFLDSVMLAPAPGEQFEDLVTPSGLAEPILEAKTLPAIAMDDEPAEAAAQRSGRGGE